MIERQVDLGDFSVKEITPLRESLGLERLNIDLLKAQSGSQDPVLAKEAQRKLMVKWEIEPERDARNAESVDLVDQMEKFSEDERKLILSQMTALQLTEGCNGHCPFCYLGKSKGVESKYSFESIKSFFRKYGSLVPKDFILYDDSDPFDYRDGKHTFTDVANFLLDNRHVSNKFLVSTSIPRGSEDTFVDFVRMMAHKRIISGQSNVFGLRISVGKHNIQRVEATISSLNNVLLADGFSRDEISYLYKNNFEFKKRFGEKFILNLGVKIKSHDDIRDFETPYVIDGVVISPSGVKATAMTFPTVYEPSGRWMDKIVPGKVNIPLAADWSMCFTPFFQLIGTGRAMPGLINSENGNEFELENKFDDLILKLGRDASSMAIVYLKLHLMIKWLN